MSLTNPKVFRVATVIDAFIHIKGQLEIYQQEDKNIALISDTGKFQSLFDQMKIPHQQISFKREISPLNDLKTLFQLICIFTKERPDVIHSSTPKAGLLCAVAGFLTRVPIRIHTFTGQRWATMSGIKRILLKVFDKLICRLNTKVFSDSFSQNNFLISQGIVSKEKINCLHKGSLGGIDLKKFNRKNIENTSFLRNKFSISKDTIVFLFLGRVTPEKGILELIQAFSMYKKNISADVKLLIVGPNELGNDSFAEKISDLIKSDSDIFAPGATDRPQEFFAISDIFCIPSYREGFGTVVLEAAAMAVPSIGSKIPGLTDSIIDGKTGILVDVKSTESLFSAMSTLGVDQTLRLKYSKAALDRAQNEYNIELIANLQWAEYIGHHN